jgi:hypothetical protein
LGKIEEVGWSATPENSTQIGLKLYRVPAVESPAAKTGGGTQNSGPIVSITREWPKTVRIP